MAVVQPITPAELLAVVSDPNLQIVKFKPLFTTLFFSAEATFKTKKIMLDELDIEGVIMAPFCSPLVGSSVQRDKGFTTRDFEPGYMKPKNSIDPSKTLIRQPGEDPAADASPGYRCNKLRAQALTNQTKAIKSRVEWLAVNAVTTGKNIISGENIETYEIDWGLRAGNMVTQAGSAAWSAQDPETFDPSDDLAMYAEQATGVINVCIMGATAWRLLRSFKKFREYFDTRRGSNSVMELALKDLGDVVSMKGYFGELAIIVYTGKVTEKVGDELVENYYLDPELMVMGNTQNKGLTAYGAIQDQDAIRSGMEQNAYYPKNWIEQGDPAIEYMQTHSAPQPVPININNFVTIRVA